MRGENIQALDHLTAINKKQSDIVQELLNSGIDPHNDPVPAGRTLEGVYPSHLTVVTGNKEIVQIIFDNATQIDLKVRNKDETTPWHY